MVLKVAALEYVQVSRKMMAVLVMEGEILYDLQEKSSRKVICSFVTLDNFSEKGLTITFLTENLRASFPGIRSNAEVT